MIGIITNYIFPEALADDGHSLGISIGVIIFMVILLPDFSINLSLTVRRLHDINKEGTYVLWSFVPLVGGIILLMALIESGDIGKNYYGEDPRDIRRKKQNIENF